MVLLHWQVHQIPGGDSETPALVAESLPTTRRALENLNGHLVQLDDHADPRGREKCGRTCRPARAVQNHDPGRGSARRHANGAVASGGCVRLRVPQLRRTRVVHEMLSDTRRAGWSQPSRLSQIAHHGAADRRIAPTIDRFGGAFG